MSGLVPLGICYFNLKDISFFEIKLKDTIASLTSGVYVTEFESYWYFYFVVVVWNSYFVSFPKLLNKN